MNKLILWVTLILGSCASSDFLPVNDDSLNEVSIISLNIHYLVPDNDRTGWEERKYAVTAELANLDADIVLFQEMETFEGAHLPSQNIQLDWVLNTVDGYLAGAVGDPSVFPVTQPILFKEERYALVDQGFFFFSDTPDDIYAMPWSGRWPAFTTWVLLRERRGNYEFYVYNVHLDAFSRKNRTRGTALIQERILNRLNTDAPVILAGDFNALKGSGILKGFADAGLVRVPADGSTYHFGSGLNLYGAIDHIFHTSGFSLVEAGIVQRKWKGAWPSDHHPAYAAFKWSDGS